MPAGTSAATRERLLSAGLAEFSSHGPAGTRVDRVAASAGISKERIYSHFGSKDGLLLAVFERFVTGPLSALPFDPLDLPAYVGTLFDLLEERPAIARMLIWSGGGVSVPGMDLLGTSSTHHVRLIRKAQKDGDLSHELDPQEILLALHALPLAWHVHPGLLSSGSTGMNRRRRNASVEAARCLAFELRHSRPVEERRPA
ncbi:TetR family transcriptional regulator [Rathayibacter sp. VKM Ac-2856]|uniref:TetR/AcrR family transcriptional regulator n=1 Tax=unclassified Rathayibacter TaxID=2609250 RepID=UPI0015666816|nr:MULTISPECIES: TetR family transcriptional regulator [unclassified Rathayibacter]NQX03212.1 TetR family transcriptional regulator [Rathayibacter sp. VKM Ac-2858]NQX18380.1 TetR family transcriptional regulator [Rathayibacter sp. VKM Ac-2856]